MTITEDFISHFAGNPSVAANGKQLAQKGSFSSLCVSEDSSLLFGGCQGSGKTPYACSVDFMDPEQPIARCSCPSRQIPCKHAVGLLYSRFQGKTFTTGAIPEDILSKRKKLKAKEEKQEKAAQQVFSQEQEGSREQGKSTKLTKQKAAAATKKYQAQLEGITLAEKIVHNIVKGGLHSIDRQNEKLYNAQVKEMGNYYVNGIQAALTDLLTLASQGQKDQEFAPACQQLSYLNALLQKAKAHTQNKIADLAAFPEIGSAALQATFHSAIEEQMGYAWKLSELADQGRLIKDARLIQMGFRVYEDSAKKEFVDEGIWLCLNDGQIYLTKNYRPFKARKYIRAEDSFFPLLETSALYVYPGETNPRIRWDRSTQRALRPEDFAQAQKTGDTDYASVIKHLKALLSSPLGLQTPLMALRIAGLGHDQEGRYYALDGQGTGIPLLPSSFGYLLPMVSREQAEGRTLVCRFARNSENLLYGEPIALITDDAVIRFGY